MFGRGWARWTHQDLLLVLTILPPAARAREPQSSSTGPPLGLQSHTSEQVASPQNDNCSIPYLITPHVLAPGDRKLFSTDISIKSHVLGEGTKRESPSPLSGDQQKPHCAAHSSIHGLWAGSLPTAGDCSVSRRGYHVRTMEVAYHNPGLCQEAHPH